MNVLVTGGAGFIGSHVVDVLIEAGHRVSIVDSLWERGGGRMENVHPQARFYKVDIRDAALAEVLAQERPQVVCHLAAQHSVRVSTDDPAYDAQVNILGLINLLQCCTRLDMRADKERLADKERPKVVFASSAAIYGTPTQVPLCEDSPQCPQSPYGITKMAGEHYLRYWREAYGLDFTALRYGNVYGPRQDPTGEAGVVAIFTRAFLRGDPVRIDWDGEQQRDYVYVRDVARANLLALTEGSGEAFCIATGKGTSVNALYQALARIAGYEVEIARAPKRPGDIYLSYFDCQKAAAQLGWQAEVSLEEGLSLLVDDFRKQGVGSRSRL